MTTIYLINDNPGDEGEATANNQRVANALKPFGFRECTRAEWLAMKKLIERLDAEAAEAQS